MIAAATVLPTVWVRPAEPGPAGAGCGHCGHATAAACEASPVGRVCADPELRGDPQAISRVLRALRAVREQPAGPDIVTAHLVGRLQVGDGEAELALTVSPRCGSGRRLFEDAFAALRAALPDTDVYVCQAA